MTQSNKQAQKILQSFVRVRDIFDFNLFPGAKLLGGAKGLDNKSTLIIVLETPNGMEWMQGGEIVLTAGYAFSSSSSARESLIVHAKQSGAAAICVKEGRYFGDISATLIEQANELDIPLIVMPQSTVYSSVITEYYNHLYAIHSRDLINQNQAYFELLSIHNEQTSTQDVIEKLQKIIGHPIILKNHYKEDSLLIDFDKISTTPSVRGCGKERFVRFVLKTTEILSYLDVYAEEELNLFQLRAIEYGISLIKKILLSDQISNWSRSELHQTLGVMLLNSFPNPDILFISKLIEIMHWKENSFFVLCFRFLKGNEKPSNDSGANHSICVNIRKYFESSTLGKFLYVEAEEEMILFVSAQQEKIDECLTTLFKNTRELNRALRVGCSAKSTSLENLELQLQQARIASQTATSYQFFNNLGNERYLSCFINDRMSLELYQQTIQPLAAYDEKHQTKLIETLTAYFQCNMNRKETAKTLFIHPETLRYRLNKIEEITSCCPSETDGIFKLSLALALRKLQ